MKKKEQKKRIVLVEDEQILAHLITAELEKAGYEVKVERDGTLGLELILKEEPDLVLLDIMLPGMNGFQIMEELYKKKLLKKIPVVIVSNSGQMVELERARKIGVRDYLIKVNLGPLEVLDKVRQILGPHPNEKQETGKAHITHHNGALNILLVEDDHLLVDLLTRRLIMARYKVFSAIDAAQARKILKSKHIHLILLDVVLPDMDGFTFLKELKISKDYQDIPVIIVSNLSQEEEIRKGMNAGATDYIIKANALPKDILDRVDAVLKNTR